jgi:hypothetical protein
MTRSNRSGVMAHLRVTPLLLKVPPSPSALSIPPGFASPIPTHPKVSDVLTSTLLRSAKVDQLRRMVLGRKTLEHETLVRYQNIILFTWGPLCLARHSDRHSSLASSVRYTAENGWSACLPDASSCPETYSWKWSIAAIQSKWKRTSQETFVIKGPAPGSCPSSGAR